MRKKVVDATGKGRSGLAHGYAGDIGNMDECLSIDQNIEDTRIAGQYCLVHLNFPLLEKTGIDYTKKVHFSLKGSKLEGTVYEMYAEFMEMMMFTPTTFKFGLCFPSACDASEMQRFMTKC